MRNPFSLAAYISLSKTIQNDGVDVAHILAGPHEVWLAILACLLRAIPVTGTMIVPKPNIGDNIPPFLSRLINKILAYGSDMIIVNGEDQVKFVQNLYGLPANRVAFVPLNARTTAVKWSVQRNAEEPGTVLFFGRAELHKGLEYLVQAQPLVNRLVPHARILISAHGKDLERCRQMIRDQSKFVITEGVVPGDVMAALFQRAALVALPYLTASTSGVLMTAYSFAKPVVASRVGCLGEYVKDGVTGLLVTPGDVEQLADAIVRLLSNNTLRQKMGENAARWVEERQEKIAAQTLAVYEKAIGMRKDLGT